MSHQTAIALGGAGTATRERKAALIRMGRSGRLAAYRRDEFDFDMATLWASTFPHEVPRLHGEYDFIAARDAEYECAHGNLPGDRVIECECFASRSAP
jgi:hypothetical protein